MVEQTVCAAAADNLDATALPAGGTVVGFANSAKDPENTVQQEESDSAALSVIGRAVAGSESAARMEIGRRIADLDRTELCIEFEEGTVQVDTRSDSDVDTAPGARLQVSYTVFAVRSAVVGTGLVERHNCCLEADMGYPTHKAFSCSPPPRLPFAASSREVEMMQSRLLTLHPCTRSRNLIGASWSLILLKNPTFSPQSRPFCNKQGIPQPTPWDLQANLVPQRLRTKSHRPQNLGRKLAGYQNQVHQNRRSRAAQSLLPFSTSPRPPTARRKSHLTCDTLRRSSKFPS